MRSGSGTGTSLEWSVVEFTAGGTMLPPPGGRAPDRLHGLGRDQLDARLPQLGGCARRIAVDAVAWPARGADAFSADQARVDGQHERGVGEPGMAAHLGLGEAAGDEQTGEVGLARPIVLLHGMDADG